MQSLRTRGWYDLKGKKGCLRTGVSIVSDCLSQRSQYLKVHIDGKDAFLSVGNARMYMKFTKIDTLHQFGIRDNAHTWEYWRTDIEDGLSFIGKSFYR